LLAGAANVAGVKARGAQGGLRTLTTAREAHSLTAEEAARAYPVHLRAVVTYHDPYIDPEQHAILFVRDATGSICARGSKGPVPGLRAGELIDLEGVSAPGDYAPIIEQLKIKALRESHVATHAPRVGLARLLTGTEDCRSSS
jgi:hypothetical protein